MVAKTTVILLAAAVASLVLRRASAALRHLVWTLALSSALVLPIASFALPKWQLSLVTISAPTQTRRAAVSIPDDNENPTIVAPPFKREPNAAGSLPADAGRHETRENAPQPATRRALHPWSALMASNMVNDSSSMTRAIAVAPG